MPHTGSSRPAAPEPTDRVPLGRPDVVGRIPAGTTAIGASVTGSRRGDGRRSSRVRSSRSSGLGAVLRAAPRRPPAAARSGRVAAAGQQAEQPAPGGLRPVRHRRVDPACDQRARPGRARRRGRRRRPPSTAISGVDPLAAQFGAQCRPAERPVAVLGSRRTPRRRPRRRSGRPRSSRSSTALGDVVRDLLAAQRRRQAGPRPGAHRSAGAGRSPGHRLRITGRILRDGRRLGRPAAGRARPPIARPAAASAPAIATRRICRRRPQRDRGSHAATPAADPAAWRSRSPVGAAASSAAVRAVSLGQRLGPSRSIVRPARVDADRPTVRAPIRSRPARAPARPGRCGHRRRASP